MRGKRIDPICFPTVAADTYSLLLFTCCCIILLTIPISDTWALVKVSLSLSTSSTSAHFLQFRAGAFGSHDTAENEDANGNKTKRKQKNSNNNTNSTVEEYVAAMMERDAGQESVAMVDDNKNSVEGDASSTSPEESTRSATKTTLNDTSIGNENASVVGVKSHKKSSNAVGDPDDDDDDDEDISEDDDDDENDSQSEYSEEWEEIEDTLDKFTDNMFEPKVEVGDEMVGEEGIVDHNVKGKTKGGGGVGVRLDCIANQRTNNRRKTETLKTSYDQTRLLRAWNSFIYFPPTPSALSFLSENARLFDSSSKNRLDRRTLYAGLLLEWGAADSQRSSTTRKFLPVSSSQALQAALSLATQPQWRQSTPRLSGIRLYSDDENAIGSTLGMQETIAMALVSCSRRGRYSMLLVYFVAHLPLLFTFIFASLFLFLCVPYQAHSLCCGMLILDDHVISKVRHQMASFDLSDEAMKPAALIQSLLSLATRGKLIAGENSGSISACMKRELLLGLDDPYDERATISCDDMSVWEKEWRKNLGNESSLKKKLVKPLPLLVFIRTNNSMNLLKSKSAMELLMHECTSHDSIHLITLGKGIDATTSSLPKEVVKDSQGLQENPDKEIEGSAPWFGFSNQNKNASGHNDPEGSRRFNIFLARIIDQNGQPEILGAIGTFISYST